MTKRVGELYKSFHEMIISRATKTGHQEIMILDKQDLIYLLGALLHVKKEKMNTIIKEMEDYGLLVQVNRGRGGIKYRILGC